MDEYQIVPGEAEIEEMPYAPGVEPLARDVLARHRPAAHYRLLAGDDGDRGRTRRPSPRHKGSRHL